MQVTPSHIDSPGSANWDQSPEIIAISALRKDDLKKLLRESKDLISRDAPGDAIHVWAEKTRRSFSAKDPLRLLLALDREDDATEVIDHAIECVDARQESIWTEKSIFYGENPDYGKLAFIFPGQGSQYVNMGKDIIDCFPEARIALHQVDDIVEQYKPLSKVIYPDPGKNDEETKANEERLRATDIAQPAIGAISLAMIKVLDGFGIKPDAACGHSYGELPALFCSGRFSEDSLLKLSAARGRYMALAGKGKDCGTMLAVRAPLDRIDEILNSSEQKVILANRNSPDQGVLSGPTDAILKIKDLLKEKKIRSTLLPVAAAFHSSLVKDAAEPFQQTLKQFDFSESKIPVYSNTTGGPYPVASQDAKSLLGIHLINPVNFMNEITNMHKDGVRVFLEVGPKSVLTGLVKSILAGRNFTAIAVDGSSGRRSGMSDLAKALCQLTAIGYPLNISQWRKSI